MIRIHRTAHGLGQDQGIVEAAVIPRTRLRHRVITRIDEDVDRRRIGNGKWRKSGRLGLVS